MILRAGKYRSCGFVDTGRGFFIGTSNEWFLSRPCGAFAWHFLWGTDWAPIVGHSLGVYWTRERKWIARGIPAKEPWIWVGLLIKFITNMSKKVSDISDIRWFFIIIAAKHGFNYMSRRLVKRNTCHLLIRSLIAGIWTFGCRTSWSLVYVHLKIMHGIEKTMAPSTHVFVARLLPRHGPTW